MATTLKGARRVLEEVLGATVQNPAPLRSFRWQEQAWIWSWPFLWEEIGCEVSRGWCHSWRWALCGFSEGNGSPCPDLAVVLRQLGHSLLLPGWRFDLRAGVRGWRLHCQPCLCDIPGSTSEGDFWTTDPTALELARDLFAETRQAYPLRGPRVHPLMDWATENAPMAKTDVRG